MAPPRLSVLISTYNDRALVDKKLLEISEQSIFPEVEFIFVETASPQRERELLAPFCKSHNNCHLMTTDKRESLYAAWNRAWNAATGDWLCYTNMDDTMHPQLLSILRDQVTANTWDLCSVLIAKQQDSDPNRDQWHSGRFRSLPLSTRPGPFTAWRKTLAKDFGQFDAQFLSAGDKDFWARAQAQNLKIGVIAKVLYLYTYGAGQLSKQGLPPGEQERLNSKPYPMVWPQRYATLCRLNGFALRLAPSRLVPQTD